jgi:phenylpropionate dioxygenase-like ring-hydroxylating dioxygenase large terminal subunit
MPRPERRPGIPLPVAKSGGRPSIDLEAEADRQRCGALKEFWYVACLSEELRDRPLARTVLGTPLVLFRDRAGRAAALLDRCLHRNARLSAGVVLPEGLACAYHGWTYDGGGACVAIPSLGPRQHGELPRVDHDAAGLHCAPAEVGRVESFAVVEQDGLVYVALVDEAATRRPPFRIPFRGERGWVVYDMVTRFPNGVTNLVENFMDVPHTAFVHRGWFRSSQQRRIPARVQRHDGQVLVTYQQDQDSLSGLGRLFNPRGLPLVHTDHFFVPNVTRVDYRWGQAGFTITSQCTPIGPADSLVYTAISYRLPVDLPGQLVARATKPLVRWYTRQVIQQDVRIMGIQRDGLLAAPGGGTFQSTEADLLHADIEAYRTWLRAGAEGPPPVDADRTIAFWV